MNVVITAAVCTHNRADVLVGALASLTAQTLPADGCYEILVVDNASTDGTAPVLAKMRHPLVRVVREECLGLSHARNRALKEARGTYVAFTDDDALAVPEWLERMLALLHEHRADVGMAGGKVEPLFETARPLWLPDALLGYFSIVDWAPRPTTLSERQWLPGVNLGCLRQRVLDAGGFPTWLGLKGRRPLYMEEIALQRQLRRQGWTIRYDPRVLVQHRISASRMTLPWLRERSFWQGVSDAMVDRRDGHARPWFPWLRLAADGARLAMRPWRWAQLSRQDRLLASCQTLCRAGYLMGFAGLIP